MSKINSNFNGSNESINSNYLLDTNVFIKAIEEDKKCLGSSICIVTIVEMLRNKSEKERIEKLKKINSFIKKNQISIYYDPSLSDNPTDNYDETIKICKKTIDKLATDYIVFINDIFIIIAMETCKIKYKNVDVNLFKKIMNKCNYETCKFIDKCRERIIEAVFENNKKNNDKKFFTEIFIALAKKLNEEFGINIINTEIKSINMKDIIINNDLKPMTYDYLKTEYCGLFETINGDQNKTKILLFYSYQLLHDGGKIEYNDFVDMEIVWCAYDNGLKLMSMDKKANKLYEYIKEQNF